MVVASLQEIGAGRAVWDSIMAIMAITVGLLFAIGFAGGYFARASLSWLRRSKLKKQRAERAIDERQTDVGSPVASIAAGTQNA